MHSSVPDGSDLIGVRYNGLHGRNKDEGFDCYGLVMEVSRRFGHELPEIWYGKSNGCVLDRNYSSVMEGVGLERDGCPAEGDVILFGYRGKMVHCGVCLSNDDYIHCDRYGVHVNKLSDGYRKEWVAYKWSK